MAKGRLLDPSRPFRVRLIKSKKQERTTADRMGAKLQPGSGNQWHSKGDSKTKEWLIENKRTDAMQYTLKMNEIYSHVTHALVAGKLAAFEVELPRITVVVLPLAVAEEMGYKKC